MAALGRVVLLLLSVLLPAQACNRATKAPNPEPSQAFPRHAQLDSEGDYFLYWDANTTHVIFEVHARTKGWVGLGLSQNGGMFPADVMIGWVKEGLGTVTDRWADAFYEPRLDEGGQDWRLLLAREDDFGTILKVARKLDTCSSQDLPIEGGTTKIIWAFHPEDPARWTGLCYHGSSRGTKDLYLLDTRPIPSNLPEDTQTFDILNRNTLIPAQQTYYHCITFRLPEVSQKHHIVAFEPVLESEELAHHILVYSCPWDLGPGLAGREYECYSSLPPELRPLRGCLTVMAAWAVGGETLYLPENVGIAIGDGFLPNFFILETHYNNPRLLKGKRDNSGLRAHFTKTLRPYDASMLMVGQAVNPIGMIPPNFPNFVLPTFCEPSCVQKGLAGVANQEIKVVGALLHTHLLGRKLILRHFRQGKELPVIAKDLSYDFDFQEFRLLNEEVVVKAGDTLVMECHYDSSRRAGMTYAGWGTEDEMCLAFLLYYPRSSLSICNSLSATWDSYNVTYGPQVFPELQSVLINTDWSQEANRQAYQQAVTSNDQNYFCVFRHSENNQTYDSPSGPVPVKLTPYTAPPRDTCADK